jgi:uncharacterized damage-inducible protein DinB
MSVAALIQEFEMEAATTRRLLERVPTDKLDWTPHTKSMNLGKLAMHVASAPSYISTWPLVDNFEFTGSAQPVAASTADILAAHDAGIATVKANLTKLGDAGLAGMWSASAGGKKLMSMPRAAMVRALLMSHTYHHRGQLSVYLRLLDVPVPPIYGPSADENPFG